MGKAYYSLFLIFLMLPLVALGDNQIIPEQEITEVNTTVDHPVVNEAISIDPEESYQEVTNKRGQTAVIIDVSAALIIDSDAEMITLAASHGWDLGGRNGSSSSPYLVTGYTFGANQTYSGMVVSDTTLYMEIDNNIFESDSSGIIFVNVENIAITNNVMDSDVGAVISLTDSSWVNIIGNTFERTENKESYDGIFAFNPLRLNITGNQFIKMGRIYLDQSGYTYCRLVWIKNNSFISASETEVIWSETCEALYIENNIISLDQVEITSAVYTIDVNRGGASIINNTINFSGYGGINVRRYAEYVDIRDNNITIREPILNAITYGIKTYSVEYTFIYDNKITVPDQGYGLYLERSTGITDGNEIHATMYSVFYDVSSPGSELYNNSLYGIIGFGIENYGASQLILKGESNNTVNDHPLLYLGNTIGGNYSGTYGQILLANSTLVRIHDSTVPPINNGVSILYGSLNTIEGNTFFSANSNEITMEISFSTHNTITDNIIQGGGVFFRGDEDSDYMQANVSGNTINNLPLVFNQNKNNTLISTPAGQVIIIGSKNVTLINQDIHDVVTAITIIHSEEVIIANNKISAVKRGIWADGINDLKILNNTISDTSSYSLLLYSNSLLNSNVYIYENDFRQSESRLLLFNGENYTIQQNNFYDSQDYGIYSWYAENTKIIANNFTNCGNPCIYQSGTGDIYIHWNNFYGSDLLKGINYNVGNNYFSTNVVIDDDGDGIDDESYSGDPFPLVHPFEFTKPDLTISQTELGKINLFWSPSNNSVNNTVSYSIYYSGDMGVSWDLVINTSSLNYNFDVSALNIDQYIFRIDASDGNYIIYDFSETFIYDHDFPVPTTESTDTTTPTTPTVTTTTDAGIGANFFFGLFVIAVPVLWKKSQKP